MPIHVLSRITFNIEASVVGASPQDIAVPTTVPAATRGISPLLNSPAAATAAGWNATTTSTGGLTVATSGIWGAGFQNAGDKANETIHGASLLVSGADVAGVHLSQDGGDSWLPMNAGFNGQNDTRCAGMRWSETVVNRVYHYSSTQDGNGADNQLWRGTYSPATGTITSWVSVATIPDGASAGNTVPVGVPGPGGHPRQTGRKMLCLDEPNDRAYLGTVNGIYRVILSTGVVTQLVLAGTFVTSVYLDPLDSTTLFATADGGTSPGVHRITSVLTTPVVATYSPANLSYCQGCVPVVEAGATRLYVATGRLVNSATSADSVVRWNGSGFTVAVNWLDISGNINADETTGDNRWAGIDAVRLVGDTTTRILVTKSLQVTGGSGDKVAWTDHTSGIPTWQKSTGARADYRINNTAGPTWWLSDPLPSLMIDFGGYDSVNPIIDRNNHSTWYVFGRSGMWRTVNDGIIWHPICRGTAVTTSWAVLASRLNPSNVCVADYDWTFLRSTDGFQSQPIIPLNRPSGAVGYNLAQGPDGTVVFCQGEGTSASDPNAEGACWTHPNPWSTGSWTNQVLTGANQPYASVAGTPRTIGACLTDQSGVDVLLVAFQAGGVRRKAGLGAGGAWNTTAVDFGGVVVAGVQNGQRVQFATDGASVIWMVDPATGIWQSIDGGLSFTRRQTFSTTNDFVCSVAADPTTVGQYFFTRPNQVWRVTNGHTTSPVLTQVGVGTIPNPSWVTVNPVNGHVAVTENATATVMPRLWTSTNEGGVWTNRANSQYENAATTVRYMSWASDNTLYVTLYSGYLRVTGL